MKNRIIILGIIFLLITIPFQKEAALAAAVEDGIYQIQVNLWHASADKPSMGNNALNQNGILKVKDGKGILELEFKGMTFAGLSGYLSQLDLMTDIRYNEFSYPEKYSTVPATVLSTYDVTDEFNRADSSDVRCAGKRYPKRMSIPVEVGVEYTWVHVYVPVMGSLGAGDQEARIKLDYTTLKEMKQTLTLEKSKFTLAAGKTAVIKASAYPEGSITYKSSNTRIATVSKKGVIKAVKKGNAKIVVTCNGIKKTVQVTVK